MKLTLKKAKEMMERNGGWLYLRGTNITALPEGLTVCGGLYLSGTNITDQSRELKKVKKLHNGDYAEGQYLYADGILTRVKFRKTINGYTYFKGKIPGRNVVFDGYNYAHCNKWQEGIDDLLYKSQADRGAEQYRGLSLDKKIPVSELKTMYRVITGACRQGTEAFIQSLGDSLKDAYTIREAIELTNGQYGAQRFREFFHDAA